jgi:hypothetical protein
MFKCSYNNSKIKYFIGEYGQICQIKRNVNVDNDYLFLISFSNFKTHISRISFEISNDSKCLNIYDLKNLNFFYLKVYKELFSHDIVESNVNFNNYIGSNYLFNQIIKVTKLNIKYIDR